MKAASALLAGVIFGAGLAISGMADPARVLGFLVISADWDPSLIGVMGGAVLTAAIGYALVTRRGRPLADSEFRLPTSTRVDGKLIFGAALFGVGWGLAGYCPGPGFVGVALLDARAVVFLVAFFAGVLLYETVSARLRSSSPAAAGDG